LINNHDDGIIIDIAADLGGRPRPHSSIDDAANRETDMTTLRLLLLLCLIAVVPALADPLVIPLTGVDGLYVARLGESARSTTFTLAPEVGSIGDLAIHWTGEAFNGQRRDGGGNLVDWVAELVAFVPDPHGGFLWAVTMPVTGAFDLSTPFTTVGGGVVASWAFLLNGPVEVGLALVASQDDDMEIVAWPEARLDTAAIEAGTYVGNVDATWGGVKALYR
jgi:hypothetical protein